MVDPEAEKPKFTYVAPIDDPTTLQKKTTEFLHTAPAYPENLLTENGTPFKFHDENSK